MNAQAPPALSGLFASGLNHERCDPAVAARAFSEHGDWPLILRHLAAQGVDQAVWLSTCNRLEVIGWHRDPDRIQPLLQRLVADRTGLVGPDLWPWWQDRRGVEAARHLLGIACALKSEQVGEPFVLGQVRSAWHCAQRCGLGREPLHGWMQLAFRTAALVRQNTSLHEGPISLSSAACRRVRLVCGEVREQALLVQALTPLAAKVVKGLRQLGLEQITVLGADQRLAQRLRYGTVAADDLPAALQAASIVIGSGAIAGTGPAAAAAAAAEGGFTGLVAAWLGAGPRRLFLGDPVPPGLDPATRSRALSLADLEALVAEGIANRQRAAAEAWAIIDRQLEPLRVPELEG